MPRRYTVRIRHPMEPHTFALRLNADGGNPRVVRETTVRREATGRAANSKRWLDIAGGDDRTTAANV